jgi:hypothetical protein
MKSFCYASLFAVLVCTFVPAQPNPLPFVNQPLIPTSVKPGSAGFTLTVTGTGFASAAVVQWNQSPCATTFVSGSELQAAISASDVATASTASVSVLNPPPGGGASNRVYFPIRQSSPTFRGTRDLNFAPKSQTLAVGDFNNDGKLDVAETNGLQLEIYLGNGDGTFVALTSTITSPVAYLLAADFDGDGNLDLLASGFNYRVAIFRGNGDGTFTQGKTTRFAGFAVAFAAADFNADGELDFVHTEPNQLAGYQVVDYLNHGDGTFFPAWNAGPICPPTVPAIGDFNGDGKLDFTANGGNVYLGQGGGSFTALLNVGADLNLSSAAADVNGDGKLDLIGDRGAVALGNGDGTFTQISDLILPGGNVVLGDVNGDGRLDIVVRTVAPDLTQSIEVLLGNGDGTFQSSITIPAGTFNQKFQLDQLQLGDFNGDGKLDVIVGGKATFLLLQQ